MPGYDPYTPVCPFLGSAWFGRYRLVLIVSIFFLFALGLPSPAQEAATAAPADPSPTLTLPAETRLVLVLTHPVQTRRMHRGDDVYAQITAPVSVEDQVVLPPATYIQGKLDKIEPKAGRGRIRLHSLTMTFPNGYVVPIPGTVSLEVVEGYAWKDPGNGRSLAAILMPLAGAGIGAAIGHGTGSNGGTVSPATCVEPGFGCVDMDMRHDTKMRNTVIGAAAGSAIGGIGAIVVLARAHDYFLEVGAPVEMVLQQPLSLDRQKVKDAVSRGSATPLVRLAPRSIPSALAGRFNCPALETWCQGRCVSDSSFSMDSMNCGRCGNSCSAGESCSLGSCTRPTIP